MPQTPVSTRAFKAAREEGKTVKELAQEFDISVSSAKQIIEKLGLPKRATKPGFTLVDDVNAEITNSETI
tara:strand:+ start:10909 stop:11118 length:210 start_codon:yes stop_codon:yes gene_type:complete